MGLGGQGFWELWGQQGQQELEEGVWVDFCEMREYLGNTKVYLLLG